MMSKICSSRNLVAKFDQNSPQILQFVTGLVRLEHGWRTGRYLERGPQCPALYSRRCSVNEPTTGTRLFSITSVRAASSEK